MNRKARRKIEHKTEHQCREEMRRMFHALGSVGLDMDDTVVMRKVLKWFEFVKSVKPKSEGIREAYKEMLEYTLGVKKDLESYAAENAVYD